MKIFPILKLVNFHLNDHCKHLCFNTWWAAISMTSVWVRSRVSSGIWVIVRSGICVGVIIGIIASLFVLIIGLISIFKICCCVNFSLCTIKFFLGISVWVDDVLERWYGRCDVVVKLLSIVSEAGTAGILIIFCCDCDCCCRCGFRCCCCLGFCFVQNVDAWCWWQKKGYNW